MSSRWFRFFIVIAIGIAAGLYYGWVIDPVEFVDATPEMLSADYKTDYVLMVSESFHADQDLALAISRLADLGNAPPAKLVQDAIDSGRAHDYAEQDLELMQALADALSSQSASLGTLSP
jgi:hypothetical protein